MEQGIILHKKYCTTCKRKDVPLSHKNRQRNRFQGLTQYYVCRECNTKRYRVYRKTKRGKKLTFEAVYRSMKKNKEKVNARALLNYHIRQGNLVKPKHCKCGNSKVEGHHNDYSKPKDVQWLCRSCHADLHRGLREMVK